MRSTLQLHQLTNIQPSTFRTFPALPHNLNTTCNHFNTNNFHPPDIVPIVLKQQHPLSSINIFSRMKVALMNKPMNLFNPLPASASRQERLDIASTLTALYGLADPQSATIAERASEAVDISHLLVALVEDSEFDHSHRSSRTVFRQLVRQPEFMRLSGPFGPGEDDFFLITEDGQLLQAEKTQPSTPHFEAENITDVVTRAIPGSTETLKQLAKVSPLTGGIVSSSQYIPLEHWLNFHQLAAPHNIQDLSNLVNLLQLELPTPPIHGNYWGLMDDTGEPTLALHMDHHALIRQCIAHVVGTAGSGPQPLLDYLADAMISITRTRTFLQELPEQGWALIIDTPQARAFAQACFDAMNPQASAAEKVLTAHQRSALLVAAVMLDFGLADESQQRFYHSFHLYEPRYVQANRFDITQKFTDIVVNSFQLQPTTAPLALQLIFAGLAPEFLVQTPAELQLGSLGWVMLRKAVLLAENIAPGLSRCMSYEALVALGAIAPASPEQQTLHDLIMTRCILDWATINGVDLDGAENLPTQTVVEHAMAQYNAFFDEISEAFTHITTPPVSRKAQAAAALREAGLDPESKLWISGEPHSLVDRYLARKLWHPVPDPETAVKLELLEPANTAYAREIDRQHALLKNGVATCVRLALSRMDLEERVAIEQGHLALYRVIKVRRTTGSYRSPDDYSAPYAVVMLTRFNDEVRTYELFPLAGTARENTALNDQLGWRNMWNEEQGEFKAETAMSEASIDYHACFRGKALDDGAPIMTSNILLERFAGFSHAVEVTYRRSPQESFNSRRLYEIAEQLSEHTPPLPYDAYYAMGYDKTAIEEREEKSDQVVDTILNAIIPFKECIEGLASGKADRRDSALFSCVMDTTVILFAFVGVAGSFIKAASGSARLFNLGKVSASFVLSLFNPLDGAPDLLRGGAKLLGKGAIKLSQYGGSVTRLGARQLRRLTSSSSGSYDLIKALSKTGAAAEIRMSLPTVAHARALFKDDTLETVEQVVARLSDKTVALPKGASPEELEQLFNNAVRETALPTRSVQELESLIGRQTTSQLLTSFMESRPKNFDGTHFKLGASDYVQTLEALAGLEAKKVAYLNNHQQNVLKQDLGKPPYNDVMAESTFNPLGFTDDAQRAGAWMVKGATSQSNDLEHFVGILREYAGNKKSLTDAATIMQIHDRLAPYLAGAVRQPGQTTKFGASITGFGLLERHLKTLDAAHEHFDKHLLSAIAAFQGFGDGNGRTASALYAIAQLRQGKFQALPKHVYLRLSDLA
jgi:hypothetical protein